MGGSSERFSRELDGKIVDWMEHVSDEPYQGVA